MADKERRGMAARLLEGKERGDVYPRSNLSPSHFSLFWDLLRGRFGKLVLLNFIVLLTLLPIVGIMAYRYLVVSAQDMLGPFGAGLNVGYPAFPDVIGYAERSVFYTDFLFFALLIPASAIAAIGVSGGMYIVRNLIRTEGIFVAKDFWQGVKRNFLSVFEALLIFTLILLLARITGNLANWNVALDHPQSGWLIASKVVGYVIMSFMLLICLWMVPLGINYKQGPFELFRNAIAMTVGTFPQTVLFAALGIAPIFIILFVSNTFLFFLATVFYLTIGISWLLLIWMDYAEWAFDRFISPDTSATQKAAGGKEKAKTDAVAAAEKALAERAALREYRRLIVAQGKSRLISRPVKPIDEGAEPYHLPETFSREDLRKLSESRKTMEADVTSYEEAHKNDERYVEYNRQFEDREKALEGNGKKKKPPKRPPKMLKR